jgi:hypothetical protein
MFYMCIYDYNITTGLLHFQKALTDNASIFTLSESRSKLHRWCKHRRNGTVSQLAELEGVEGR